MKRRKNIHKIADGIEDNNFSTYRPARLIQAKDKVENRLQVAKYAMIADTIEQLGGKSYRQNHPQRIQETGRCRCSAGTTKKAKKTFDL